MIKKILQTILIIFLSFILCLFIYPVFCGILNLGNIAGILICLILIAVIVFASDIKKLFTSIISTCKGRIITSIICFIVALGIGIPCILSYKMIKAADCYSEKSDTIIVLGCKLNGTQPSRMLKNRLDAAIEYHKINPDAPIIVSGGQGTNEIIPEAEAMKNYLISRGIDKNIIIAESFSQNTEENIYFSFDIIEKQKLGKDITIITDRYHQYRAYLYAEKYTDSISAYSGYTDWYFVPTYWVREWLGLFKTIFL